MMIFHYSPSNGQQCGIAYFAKVLDKNLPGSTLISKISNAPLKDGGVVVLEHEYGLSRQIEWDELKHVSLKKICIMHAFAPTKQYQIINDLVMNGFDKIVFLSNKCRLEANIAFPQHADKFEVIPHYIEPIEMGENNHPHMPILGIHGFGFPRNGFIQLLDAYEVMLDRTKLPPAIGLHVMASVNSFNNTARVETSVHIDKIRRKIWGINDKAGQEIVTLDSNYYETKEEVMRELVHNCSILVHMTRPAAYYYNASGSLLVLLSTGLPVFALHNIFTEELKDYCVICEDATGVLNNVNVRAKKNISEYALEHSPAKFAEALIKLA